MSSNREPSDRPPTVHDLGKMRRRQFLAWMAGAAGGLGLARSALGRSFLPPAMLDPESPVGLAPAPTTASTTYSTVVTTPSTTWSTTFTLPGEPFTGTAPVYSTTSQTGTGTFTATTRSDTQTVTTTLTGTSTWSGSVTFTVSITHRGTQTQSITNPSGSKTVTVTRQWTYALAEPAPTLPVTELPPEPSTVAGLGPPPKRIGLARGVSAVPPPGGQLGLGV